jgi:hypothetical protein
MTVTPADDVDEPAGAVTYYVIYDDGSIGRIVSSNGEQPPLSKPGRFVTEAEYQTRADELEAEHAEHIAEMQAADEARAREDYEALIAAGIPEATARRMSGYTGPAEES